MDVFISALVLLLAANAVIAFGIAFFWQVKVIFTLLGASTWDKTYAPWKALSDTDSPQNSFGRFFSGEIFPELRRKWLKAIGYAVGSFVVLFVVAGVLQIVAPEYLL